MPISPAARQELRRLVVLAAGEFDRVGDTVAAENLRALRNVDDASLDGGQVNVEAWEQLQRQAWRTADHGNWAAAQAAVWARLDGLANPIDWAAIIGDPDPRARRLAKALMRLVCLRATRHVTDGG